jgi:deoxycytidylate deaminase
MPRRPASEIIDTTGPSAGPPDWAILQAELVATDSPCQKRGVGIAMYRCERQLPGGRELVASGVGVICAAHNSPPVRTPCDGTPECRRDCRRRCVHAEMRAIDIIPRELRPYGYGNLRMVHVKLDDSGKLMPCYGPSCDDCSKHILDFGVGGIWLYEVGQPPCWVYYPAKDFHEITCARVGVYQVPR